MGSTTLIAGLQALRQTLEHNWCAGSLAQTATGQACDYRDAAAARYCLYGGVWRFLAFPDAQRACAYLRATPAVVECYRRRRGPDDQGGSLVWFNDQVSHRQVLLAVDQALGLALAALAALDPPSDPPAPDQRPADDTRP